MEYERSDGTARSKPGTDFLEAGLTVLLESCERAIEDVTSAVPPAQMVALQMLDRAGRLNLSQLASRMGASASSASRLCDRIEAAGLLQRDRPPGSRREIVLRLTESGQRLAAWARRRRCTALDDLLQAMSKEGREALVRGLAELARQV